MNIFKKLFIDEKFQDNFKEQNFIEMSDECKKHLENLNI